MRGWIAGNSVRDLLLKIRRAGLWDGEQVLAVNIAVIFSAYRLQMGVGYFAPTHDHIQRLVEGVGVIDRHQHFEPAVRQYLKALDDMLFLGMRRAVPIEEAVVRLQPIVSTTNVPSLS